MWKPMPASTSAAVAKAISGMGQSGVPVTLMIERGEAPVPVKCFVERKETPWSCFVFPRSIDPGAQPSTTSGQFVWKNSPSGLSVRS